MEVVVTGSLGYDYIMNFPGKFSDRIMPDKIHKISLSFLVDTLSKQMGGTAGNIAYSLNLLNTHPIILASAGNDFEPYLKFLQHNKISTTYIKIYEDVTTGSYFVVTDQDDNQIGSFYTGALKYAPRLRIATIKPLPGFAILAPNDPKAMLSFASECQESNIPYLFDPAFQIENINKSGLHKAISRSQIFIGNDYEISLTEKILSLTHVQLTGMVPILITTLGAQGSIIEYSEKKIVIKPAKPKNISDPTGAGDAFRSGFVAGYMRGFDLKTCGQMGSVAAVYTVEKYGTMTHKYLLKEFVARYQKNFDQKLVL